MSKDDDKNRISEIGKTKETAPVKRTEAISEVEAIKPTSGIEGISPTGDNSSARRKIKLSESDREEVFKLVDEESEALFKKESIPERKKAVIKKAVKMAIDSGLISKTDLDDEGQDEDR
ncbi:MAG TPA: hypothetical protein PKD37_07425 [Oligoflexia bacterium]|nr:hypothetical protein [Oligoflexia bacterium]HMP27793.1 hypothetical protein [Oligoflexia bacterium]